MDFEMSGSMAFSEKPTADTWIIPQINILALQMYKPN